MRRKKHEESHENHERWLLTYSDLITLLMIFFIVLYSFSNVDKQKYQQIVEGLNKAMGSGGGANIITTDNGAPSVDDWQPTNTEIVQDDSGQNAEASKLQEVKSQLDKYLKESGLSDSVSTMVEERGLVVRLKDSLLFDSGQSDIRQNEIVKLIDIGKILNRKEISDSFIRVEGHTDNIPISNYLYKSNWDLSVIRASNVAQLLIAQAGIQPQRISALGYGEFRPIADNSTDAGRSLNRRVEIVIMNTKFNEIENHKN